MADDNLYEKLSKLVEELTHTYDTKKFDKIKQEIIEINNLIKKEQRNE